LLAIPFAVTSYGGADSLAIFRVKRNRISFVGDATMSRPGSDIKRSMFAETYVYALSDDEVAVADTANLKARIKSVYYRGGPVNGNGGRSDDTLTVSGGLTAQEVSAVTRAHSNELLHCYERLLQRKPAARGSLELTYSINASGDPQDVKIVKGEMEDGVMRQCAVLKVRGWQFPKPRDSGKAKVQKHLIQFYPR
jgi:hypothetical protein